MGGYRNELRSAPGLPRRACREVTACGPNRSMAPRPEIKSKPRVPKGKKRGTYLARAAANDSGSFNLQTSTANLEGIHKKYCHRIQRGMATAINSRVPNTESEGNALQPLPERRGLRA